MRCIWLENGIAFFGMPKEDSRAYPALHVVRGCYDIASRAWPGLVEYALIIALVAVVAIAALVVLGPRIASICNNVNSNL